MVMLLGLCFVGIAAAGPTIVPDGEVADWSDLPQGTDSVGDARDGGRDLLEVAATGNRDFFYLRFRFDRETTIDESEGLWLLLDADHDSTTGDEDGAELRWDIGGRRGTFHRDGTMRQVGVGELGMVVAPTMTGHDGELCLPRRRVSTKREWIGGSVRFRLVDERGGDRFPDRGWATARLAETSADVESVPLGRHPEADLRVVSWNLRHDALFPRDDEGAESVSEAEQRFAAQARILKSLDPDVMIVCEAWAHSAREILDRIGELCEEDLSDFHTGPSLGGTAVLSRWPVMGSWEVHVGRDAEERPRRVVAVHVRADDRDLLVVGNHWPCCDQDAQRQESADALVAFLRDAQRPGGRITLPSGYAVVCAGDFNLVGQRQQLVTMTEGAIVDTARFGPSTPPDPDGSSLRAASARHNDAPFVHTWSNDRAPFYPGRLDWILYSDSRLWERRSYTLDTRTMNPPTLEANGFEWGDTPRASDHAPVVADFSWR